MSSTEQSLPSWVTWQARPFPDSNLILLHGRDPGCELGLLNDFEQALGQFALPEFWARSSQWIRTVVALSLLVARTACLTTATG